MIRFILIILTCVASTSWAATCSSNLGEIQLIDNQIAAREWIIENTSDETIKTFEEKYGKGSALALLKLNYDEFLTEAGCEGELRSQLLLNPKPISKERLISVCHKSFKEIISRSTPLPISKGQRFFFSTEDGALILNYDGNCSLKSYE